MDPNNQSPFHSHSTIDVSTIRSLVPFPTDSQQGFSRVLGMCDKRGSE